MKVLKEIYFFIHIYNNGVIIMSSLVLKAQSPCEIFPCRHCNSIRNKSYEKK